METNKNINSISEKVIPTRKVAISGLVIALYIVIMFVTQSIASGGFQIRIATSLYSLSAIYPFLILPLGLSNLLSNILMGGLGPLDWVGGAAIGIITASTVYFIKKLNLNEWLIAIPIIFGPGLIVPIWLSYLIGAPYTSLALSLCLGQIIPGLAGVVLVKQLKTKLR